MADEVCHPYLLAMELPSEFIKKMQKLLGDEWESFEQCYHEQEYRALRFNPLKQGFSADRQEALFKALGIGKAEAVPWEKNAYYYEKSVHPGKHPYHEAGLYYIQEPSAMSIAALLAPEPGERVLDLCAAPGGKSTKIASDLGQRGILVANEIHPQRCRILSQNIERWGIRNAVVTNEDSAKLAEHFPEYFHRILVDAPCSGEGMFRKNPEAVREWSAGQVLVCAERQLAILRNAARMLLPGGILAYSTCTFSREENEDVIQTFLQEQEEFMLVEKEAPWFDHGGLEHTFRLWPHHLRGEGHFAAILYKRGELPVLNLDHMPKQSSGRHRDSKKEYTPIDKMQNKLLQEFAAQTLTKEMQEWIFEGQLVLFGDQLNRLPEGTPSLAGLHVLRAGLHVGTFKKNRFEPSHALAITLGKADVKNYIDFLSRDERILAYYRGEVLNYDCPDEYAEVCGKETGWCLVCVDGYSTGWGKRSDGRLKNHYPKGLRKEIMGGRQADEINFKE